MANNTHANVERTIITFWLRLQIFTFEMFTNILSRRTLRTIRECLDFAINCNIDTRKIVFCSVQLEYSQEDIKLDTLDELFLSQAE